MEHDIFADPVDTLMYDWITSEGGRQALGDDEEQVQQFVEESALKVFDIFVERSGALYAEDDTLLWLREIIGYVLNQIDAGEVTDKDVLVAQL